MDLTIKIVILIFAAIGMNRVAALIQVALRRRDLRKFWEKHDD